MSASQNIFMLELFIENLKVNTNFTKNYDEKSALSLLAKFGPMKCLEIYQERVQPLEEDGDYSVLKWNAGKSALFAASAEKINDCIKNSRINLVLAKETNEIVGKAKISLGEPAENGTVSTEWMMMDGECDIMKLSESATLLSENGKELGSIQLKLRLTSCGTSIITKVSKSEDDDKFCFSADERSLNPNCKACSRPQCGEEMSETWEGKHADRKEDSSSHLSSKASSSSGNAPRGKTPRAPRKKGTRKKAPTKKPKFPSRNSELKEEEIVRSCGFGPGAKDGHAPSNRHYQCIQPQTQFRQFVPKNHGWAWTKAPPQGIQKPSKWRPGYYHKAYLKSLKRPPKVNNVGRKSRRRHQNAERDEKELSSSVDHKPSLKLVRKDGMGRVTFTPEHGEPQHQDFLPTADDSDIELELLLPKARKSKFPQVLHKAQQFNEEDFEETQELEEEQPFSNDKSAKNKNIAVKRKANPKNLTKFTSKKNKTSKNQSKSEETAKDDIKLNAWDDWIMQLPSKTPQQGTGDHAAAASDHQQRKGNTKKPTKAKIEKTRAK